MSTQKLDIRKKISYVSADFFFDVDFPVLKNLSKNYSISWHAILPKQNPRFTREIITSFCEKYNIKLTVHFRNYRKSDPRSIGFVLRLIKSIKKDKSNVYYIEDLGDIFFSLLSILFFNINKTVVSFHDIIQHKGSKSPTLNAISQKILINNFKKIHLFSQTQRQLFNQSKNKEILVAPLFLKDFGKSNQAQIKKDIIKFLFFGRIEYYKGLDILIKAVNHLQQKGILNFELTIAGDTKTWEYYEGLMENVSNYKLKIGFFDNDKIPNLFSSHDYLILPYRDVTQSGPLFIAYNYSLPVVASDHTGFREFVEDGKTGYLFENENEIDLAKKLEIILYKHNSKQIDYHLKEYIKYNLSDEITTQKYLRFFEKI